MKTIDKSTDNRNKVYFSIVDSLPEKRHIVFNTIKSLNAASLEDIAAKLKCRVNEISGRITELKDNYFLVTPCGTSTSKRTGHTITMYRVTSEKEREFLALSAKRRLEKIKASLELDLAYRRLYDCTQEVLKNEIIRVEKKIKAIII